MAEVVQRNLELMLPELEELERSGIFSPQEIKEIVRRRRGMEYKLQRRPVRKEDFLRAITYELNLDRLRKVRKKRLGVTSARRDAEYGIQDRVHSLFKRAVKRFKADVRLWLQYIDFCQKSHHHVTLGKILARAIALHPSKPGLWVMAGKFQFETQNDPSSGRSTLQQGLRSNPSSTHLWLEYFRMELMHVDKMKKRRMMLGLEKSDDEELEKLGEEFFSFEIPSLVFHQAVKAVPDNLQLLLSFVEIYRLFDGTQQRQEEVYTCMKRDYSHLADTWEALARRHWTDSDTSSLTEREVVATATEGNVVGVYREGLGVTTQPSLLWRHYLKWCHERVTEDGGNDSSRLRAIRRLLTAYQSCSRGQHMSVDMIEGQVHVLRGMGLMEEAHKALVDGTGAHPDSHTLWLLRLRSERNGGRGEGGQASTESLIHLCTDAIKTVPAQNSLCIWQFWLEVVISGDSPHSQVEAVFQRAIAATSSQPDDQVTLSIQHIDWALAAGGVKSSRKTYKMFLEKVSVPYPIYCKCIEVEKSLEKPSMKRLREVYDKAVNDWGADHPDLWLDYISSETCMKGGDPTRVTSLHWRAMKTLTGAHTAHFVSKYSLLTLKS